MNVVYGSADWGRKWIVNFNARKSQLVSFDCLDNSDGILDEELSFEMLALCFPSKLDWSAYIYFLYC